MSFGAASYSCSLARSLYFLAFALLGTCLALTPARCLAQSASLFTAEELAWIKANPVVRTAVDPNFRPVEYLDGAVHKGLSAGYLEAVSRLTGLRFEPVPGIAWGKGRDALDAKEVDLLPAVSYEHSHSSLEGRVLITSPYFVAATVVVTRERGSVVFDIRKLAGQTVAIKGRGAVEHALRLRYPDVKVLPVDSAEDALAAVLEGTADAAIGTDVMLLPPMRRTYFGQLHVSGTLPELPNQVAMGIRRDLPILASIVDKSLNALTAKQTDAIVDRWIEGADYGEPTMRAVLYYFAPQALALAAVITAIALLAGFAWRAKLAAARSERAKAMFLAVVGHEIRTPMQTILSSVELLQRTRLDVEQSRLAGSAVTASEALLSLLDDVLQFSKLEAGKVTPELVATPIWPWATQSVDILRQRAESKGLRLLLANKCPPELVLEIDPTRLRQVLLNLLSNAIKFTGRGAITVSVSYQSGNAKAGKHAETTRRGMLTIEVHDTGIGMTPAQLRRVFEPFEQADQSTTRRFGGTGLGLAICRELVTLMGGVIGVRSEPNVQTVFTVTVPAEVCEGSLPVADAVRESSTTAVAASADRAGLAAVTVAEEPVERASLLVVDDHEAVLESIRQQLRALGCRATTAATGQDALALFDPTHFDMILLDCNLPDIDGYTLARRIREKETEWGGHIPIVAISASTEPDHHERCLASGMDGVLSKPLRLQQLAQMIEMWCDLEPMAPLEQHGTASVQAAPQPAPGSLVTLFRQSLREDLCALRQAIADGDWSRTRRCAHRIKGAALTVSEDEVAAGAASVEALAGEMSNREVTPDALETLDRLVGRLERASSELSV